MTKIPKYQYHATSCENIDKIEKEGLKLPSKKRMKTHRYNIPSISTADSPEYAEVYYPNQALIKLKIKSNAKYIKKSIRNMRRGENLEQSVNRWLIEAKQKGADGIRVEGMQSTIGNQTINPNVLDIVEIKKCKA